MLRFLKGVGLAISLAWLLTGSSGRKSASATYCGGAAYRRCPAPVIETSCQTVALVPRCETVTATACETVYENQSYTAYETRYRTAYRTESREVMRPVYETKQIARTVMVRKPVYETTNYQRRYNVIKPVYETKRVERRFSVMKPVYETTNYQRRYTVSRPVYETKQVQRRFNVLRPVQETTNYQRRYTVSRPVYETKQVQRRFNVLKPVYETTTYQRSYVVRKPVVETKMVEEPYTICRPVTTSRKIVEQCGYWETRFETIPGPVIERQVAVDPCGGVYATKRGHHCGTPVCTTTVAVQCPPRVVRRRVYVPQAVERDVTETRYVAETALRQVPVQTCSYVNEEHVENVPVTRVGWFAKSASRTFR